MPPHAFADVALPLPVDHPFTYQVPDPLLDRVQVGMRALVPLRNRVETGYVVALHDETDQDAVGSGPRARGGASEVRLLIDLPDPSPVFSRQMLELCHWLADYYCCSWGEALQAAVPAGIQIRTRMRYTLVEAQLTAGRFSERQRRIVGELHRRGPLTESQLAKTLVRGALSNTLRSLVARGVLLAEPITGESRVSIRTETHVRLVETNMPLADTLMAMQRRAPKRAAVYLDLLHGEPERRASELYEKHGVDSAVLRALEDAGLVERIEREAFRIPEFEADGRARAKLELNNEQRTAYEAVTRALTEQQFQTFLLEGITGSGKTEVYLQAIEHTLELGRDAIILVPEISLTPQTVGRFMARFQERIAVLHSGLGAGERYDEWRRAQRGEVRIVVGARSAVFAPLLNLGIIVVDEEHDTSYKQGDTPRYHARDVAIMRAQMAGAVCVLGSATPSIESYYNSERGKSIRLVLNRRATNAELPEVRIVDMRVETRECPGRVILSRMLEDEIAARVKAGEQALLLLNRRGFAPFVLCPQCGWVAYCSNCHVTLTYHAKGAFLSCHYCNARRPLPQACEECHFNPLLYLGTGTQKVEDYLVRSFPEARVERMDADTTAGKGGHAKILGRLAAGDIDILVGTQMIAKGHDYPGVTLVGVINADTGLAIPDFRAAEGTFQLLTQVAGRAGRGDKPGTVIIQTFRPNHYAIQYASKQDYAAFYHGEIAQRQGAGYPPFRRMAHLAVESAEPREAEHAAAILHRVVCDLMVALNASGMGLLGPAPATIHRVKKKYRWNLALLSRSAHRLNAVARATRDAFANHPETGKVQLKIDLDPYGML